MKFGEILKGTLPLSGSHAEFPPESTMYCAISLESTISLRCFNMLHWISFIHIGSISHEISQKYLRCHESWCPFYSLHCVLFRIWCEFLPIWYSCRVDGFGSAVSWFSLVDTIQTTKELRIDCSITMLNRDRGWGNFSLLAEFLLILAHTYKLVLWHQFHVVSARL